MAGDPSGVLQLEGWVRRFMAENIAPSITKRGYYNTACVRLPALLGGWEDIGCRRRWPSRSIPEGEVWRLRPVAAEVLPEFFSTAEER